MSNFIFEDRLIPAEAGDTVLDAVVRQGIALPHACKIGACQSCLVKCKDGDPPAKSVEGLSESLTDTGCILACRTPADSIKHVGYPSADDLPKTTGSVVELGFLGQDVLGISVRLGAPLEWRPGTFVRLTLDGTARCYSIANFAWHTGDVLRFHVRLIQGGEMSEKLRDVRVGTELTVEGPMGSCYYRPEHKDQPILLVGTGTGLAPLIGVATDALQSGQAAPICLYHGAATSAALYFREELTELASRFPGFSYVTSANAVSTPTDRTGSPVNHALEDHPELTGWRIYTCGHPDMVHACKKRAFIAGASLKEIHADPYEDQSVASAA